MDGSRRVYRWAHDELEVVTWFYHLGDAFSSGGGCELVTRIRARCDWKKLLELQPVLCFRHLSLKTRSYS